MSGWWHNCQENWLSKAAPSFPFFVYLVQHCSPHPTVFEGEKFAQDAGDFAGRWRAAKTRAPLADVYWLVCLYDLSVLIHCYRNFCLPYVEVGFLCWVWVYKSTHSPVRVCCGFVLMEWSMQPWILKLQFPFFFVIFVPFVQEEITYCKYGWQYWELCLGNKPRSLGGGFSSHSIPQTSTQDPHQSLRAG